MWEKSDDESIDVGKRGVVYYMNGERVIGMLLWNLPTRTTAALTALWNDRTFERERWADLARLVPFEGRDRKSEL